MVDLSSSLCDSLCDSLPEGKLSNPGIYYTRGWRLDVARANDVLSKCQVSPSIHVAQPHPQKIEPSRFFGGISNLKWDIIMGI